MLKKYCKLNDSNYCNINYIVYSPEKKDNNLPLLLFLHGIGERGNKVEDVEKYALPKYMNKFNIPYIVVVGRRASENIVELKNRNDNSKVELTLEEVKEFIIDKVNNLK